MKPSMGGIQGFVYSCRVVVADRCREVPIVECTVQYGVLSTDIMFGRILSSCLGEDIQMPCKFCYRELCEHQNHMFDCWGSSQHFTWCVHVGTVLMQTVTHPLKWHTHLQRSGGNSMTRIIHHTHINWVKNIYLHQVSPRMKVVVGMLTHQIVSP